jgi:hypothetical protein
MWQKLVQNVPLMVKFLAKVFGERQTWVLDIYALLDLCGLPQNDLNEGTSFKSLINKPDSDQWNDATDHIGRNNHAVVTEQYRLHQYENRAEELYDSR